MSNCQNCILEGYRNFTPGEHVAPPPFNYAGGGISYPPPSMQGEEIFLLLFLGLICCMIFHGISYNKKNYPLVGKKKERRKGQVYLDPDIRYRD